MANTIVAPSVLSLDYSRMTEQLNEVNESGAEWLHFDVMDGHFVPNLTFGPDILKGFRKGSDLFMDVHVMIEKPLFFAEKFISAGADNYTFHYEVMDDEDSIHQLAGIIHAHGKSAGISIKPDTPVTVLKPFLKDFDVFLIMSVEPGFGGQKFIPGSIDKIRTLRQWLNEAGLKAHVEVDGGINEVTAKLVKEAGADVLVAGSYIFKQNIKEAVMSLA
ncbi:MAG: ribulose-phosphate 3-epimerase [Solobacterium sp.]|nr:ribulose-phosphate 3-epimerase [Solobacterium sp.]